MAQGSSDQELLQKCRSELDEAVEELSTKYEEIMLLYDISESLGSLEHVHELTDLILEKAVTHTGADNAILFTLDREKGLLRIGGTHGVEWLDPEKYIIRPGQGTVGRVAMSGIPVIQNDLKIKGMSKGRSISALLCVPLKVRDDVIGVISVAHDQPDEYFTSSDQKLLSALAGQAAIALENASLYQGMKKMFLSIISALAATIDAKDPYTHGHSRRVTYYSMVIAQAINSTADFIETVKMAGLLHDIGKIGIPEGVLRKKGGLTESEYREIRDHTMIGVRILEHIEELRLVIPAIKHHHERFKGGGYPDGLVGENIPLAARIISIADTFDAMTTDRPYRKGMSHEDALRELGRNRGEQFDPELVRVFAASWKERIKGKDILEEMV